MQRAKIYASRPRVNTGDCGTKHRLTVNYYTEVVIQNYLQMYMAKYLKLAVKKINVIKSLCLIFFG